MRKGTIELPRETFACNKSEDIQALSKVIVALVVNRIGSAQKYKTVIVDKVTIEFRYRVSE